MPVYLCQSGSGYSEPWRHGIQVYAAPFPINLSASTTSGGGRDSFAHSAAGTNGPQWSAQQQQQQNQNASESSNPRVSLTQSLTEQRLAGMPIRRVRHAEIVLVDDVCVAFGRYWLRLRWPGQREGFAGYIAMGLVESTSAPKPKEITFSSQTGNEPSGPGTTTENNLDDETDNNYLVLQSCESKEERFGTAEEADLDDPTRDDEPQDAGSTPSAEPFEGSSKLNCLRTGLVFPSSKAMKLMAAYDDGINPTVSSAPLPTEPVFCRICREGLHDEDEQQPSGAADDDGNENAGTTQRMDSLNTDDEGVLDGPGDPAADEPVAVEPPLMQFPKGPVMPHPTYHPNAAAADNPLLAPCECSGSMAFVHYLCVEQWRCRSRHPEAHQGLNCETCGGAYSLPPPSARHANVPPVEEDWLDAMPPHVMQALRQPHLGWQIGASIVRRRWLRPVAPVIMSPLVALYCRARRMLKKRGVARRRWACSLCRRRARWKCVRCLRSYYCSRQCQNVSWHIVHKHVCYKPARFWWSVVVYGIATVAAFPGILRDPLMYDLGLCTIPVSFMVMAVLGGGLATLLKKTVGVDLRGRMFELAIVLFTLWLVIISWGIVRGFFGQPKECYGAMGTKDISMNDLPRYTLLNFARKAILKPGQVYYLLWDGLAYGLGSWSSWIRKPLCTEQFHYNETTIEGICFEHLPHVNADFFLAEAGGQRCASDLLLVLWLYVAAGFALVGSTLWKRRERQRRLAARRPHAHQD
ncbi:expressed unknown protein [Seminavis robusta]|uniref:RING-CH-type domain-containing protein n=1 Tax=Seminavis robusta TaxID=568900 RepID=A0A9N8DE07_9STRA|nr:expressed unknown protein [Seminavis robusta]|eukprot:Sro104_g052760.1 n/a (750) ;mRNA; f:37829-40173